MAFNLSPVGGVAAQFFDNVGTILSGGKLYTYLAGTTTPTPTYTTNVGNVSRTNPIVLDAAGRVPSGGEIWITAGITYKFVLTDSSDVLIGTYDNVQSADASLVSYTPAGTGAVTTTVQAKLRQTVSVMDFGATGDGSTNDYAAFVAAILYCTTYDVCLYAPAPSASYRLDSNVDFTCPFESGVYNLFSGSGIVTFSNPTVVKVFPEWWGAIAVPSQNSSSVLQTPNDCTTAINSAIRSVRFNWQPSGKTVQFGIGVYGVSSIDIVTSSLYAKGLTLAGTRSTHASGASVINTGAGGASVLQSVSASSYLIQIDGASGGPNSELHFQDLSFDGKCEKDAVLLMQPGPNSSALTVNYIYFDRCVWHNVKNTKNFVESNSSNAHEENALVYFNQCAFQLNSPLQATNTGVSIFLQNPGAWQWQFHQCYFSGTSTSGFASIYVQTGGVELQSCYFEANNNYDIGCLDGGWVHAHDCQTDSFKFAFFGTYNGGTTYTSDRGIIIENLVCPQATGTWTIVSDSATQNITLRGLFGGGVYLRSGAGNAFIENVVGGNVEFGDRSNAANTYTGKATLVNVPGVNTYGLGNTTPMGGLTIVEGTDAALLSQTIALDLISYFGFAHSAGLESFILSSYKTGVGYRDLYLRARNIYLDNGGFRMTVAGDGPVVTTPNGLANYKISVSNAGAVISTLV